MFIIKLGGSVFAPKNSTFFDRDYLKNFYQLFRDLNEDILFIHGAGNVGHSFVKQYGLNEKSYSLWRNNVRDTLWNPFSEIFPDFQRIEIEQIMSGDVDITELHGNFITGGDISSDYEIISGDDVFAFAMQRLQSPVGYMVTDVPGILDHNGSTIPRIDAHNLSSVSFWKKEGDAQNSMFTKVTALQDYLAGSGAKVWIMDSQNLTNIVRIMSTGEGVGTCIYF